MKTLTVVKHIRAPQAKVFEALSDFANAPQRAKGIKRVELLTTGPIGKGTRFRETRVMFGKEATEEMEVTQFSRPDSYTLGCTSCGCRYESLFRFRPREGGTEVEMSFTAQPLTFFAKVMGVMMGFMSGAVKKCVEGDLDDLKKYCEGAKC